MMNQKNDNIPVWMKANAWREIFTRIFEEMETTANFFPEWLLNPATKRRLKLDMYYTELGFAIRLEGVRGKKKIRGIPSLEEEEQKAIRDRARVDVCRRHGIDLIVVDLINDRPKVIFRNIDISLSQASQKITNNELSTKISQARMTASSIARRVRTQTDLKIFSELWEDRLYQVTKVADSLPPTETITFTAGMDVEHTAFGLGTVVSAVPSGDETIITVDFLESGQKKFAASIISDKLLPF